MLWHKPCVKVLNLILDSMNTKIIFGLTAVICFLFQNNVQAQVVYSSEWKSEANAKIYVSEWKSEADLIVYKTEWKSEASKNNGIWYFSEWKSESKIIYFTDWKSDADIIIYFTEWKSEAGWKKQQKRYLLD